MASFAERQARQRKSEADKRVRLKCIVVQHYVKVHIKQQAWSPEIIASQVSKVFPGSSISHEAIYQFIYAKWHEGIACLARRHPQRYKKHYKHRRNRAPIPNRVSIDVRPEKVNSREEFAALGV